MWARRAAARVKVDLADERADKLTGDERQALEPLRAATALQNLHHLRAGKSTHDAHALAVVFAMDRLEIANGLPRPLRIDAAEPALRVLFGVAPPAAPQSGPVVAGDWLDYLVAAATAAGHPISAAGLPKEQNLLAWGGVLAGIADALRRDQPEVSPELRPLVDGTVHRLDAESAANRDAVAAARSRQLAGRGDRAGLQEHGMAHCPSTVPGASTRLFRLSDGVALEVSASEPTAVADIHARARQQLAAAAHPASAGVAHTGGGTGVGDVGYCPIVLVDTIVTAEERPDGVRVTVKPKDLKNLTALFETTENRVDALRRASPTQP
jgi:hypothetical protein